jgi:fatty acid desaturase
MGVPWHNLPAYHRELQEAGYVTADITFENYFELWRSATALARAAKS